MIFDWTQRPPLGERYIQVSDGAERYYAPLPEGVSATEAVDNFIVNYRFSRREPRHALGGLIIVESVCLSWMIQEESK